MDSSFSNYFLSKIGVKARVSTLSHTLWSMHRYPTSNLYEQVKCKLKVDSGLSNYVLSIMGIKQGYPFSLTLFGLYIVKIEKIVK